MKQLLRTILISLAVFGCLVSFCQAQDMASDNYRIKAHVLSGGGGTMTSGSYTIQSTLGQSTPLAQDGLLPQSTSYDLMPGFWYQVRPQECECTLADFAASFGEITGTPSNCCDIDWDGDVDGEDLFLLIPGL